MRTIILNTLGEELRPDPLFFMPFREEELLWIHLDPERLSEGAEEIAGRLRQHSTMQNYHLVYLADLALFSGTEYENMRASVQDLLSAYFCHVVLKPLASMQAALPVMVSSIFLYSGHIPGERGIPNEELYPVIFRMEELTPESEKLTAAWMRNGETHQLDCSDLFAAAWADFRKPYEEPAKGERRSSGGTEKKPDALIRKGTDPAADYQKTKKEENLVWRRKHLRDNIREQIRFMQHYRLPRGGKLEPLELDPNRFLFPVDEDVLELVMIDLQINLSRMIEATRGWRGRGALPSFEIQTHTQEEIADVFHLAELRLAYLTSHIPSQRYFPLDPAKRAVNTNGVEAQIREQLFARHGDLLGVRAALSEEKEANAADGLTGRMKQAWFRLGKERELFLSLFGVLREQYDEEYIKKEQEDVLDTCLDTFRSWRKQTLDAMRTSLPLEKEATETVMPELSVQDDQIQDALDENQAAFTRAAADHLESYEDVRAEGITIRTEFDQRSRFWSPDALTRNLPNFRVFSGVMAVIFVVLMILPYALIEAGTVGHGVSRFVVFAVSLACFFVLYALGLLHWLRQMCARLHECSVMMADLLSQSRERRAESVREQIKVYGELLPECICLSEQQNYLAMIDGLNRTRESSRIRHERLLKKALERVEYLRTALKIPVPKGELAQAEIRRLDLNLNAAPYEEKNREIYLFFVDPVGKEEA